MLELIADNMALFWVVLVVLFALVEALTAGLTCIWFGIGLRRRAGLGLFRRRHLAAVRVVLCDIHRLPAAHPPLVRKYVDAEKQPTMPTWSSAGGDCHRGHRQPGPTGAVTVGGKVWTARSADGSRIEERCIVVVRRIEGVKLIVEPATGADLNITE